MHQRRPRLAALVRRRFHRRRDGRGDHTGKPVGRTVFGLDQRDVVGAERDGFAGGRDHHPLLRKAAADADLCRRHPADDARSGALGDDGRVHRMVEMGVHRQHGLQSVDAQPFEAAVDPRGRRRDLAQPDGGQARPGEEAVGHQRRGAVVDEKCGDTGPGHRQRSVRGGLWGIEITCVVRRDRVGRA